jgi:hypothetical protein
MACALDTQPINQNALKAGLIHRYVVFAVDDNRGTERFVVRVADKNCTLDDVVAAFKAETGDCSFQTLGGGECSFMPDSSKSIFLYGKSEDLTEEPRRDLTKAIFARAFGDIEVCILFT